MENKELEVDLFMGCANIDILRITEHWLKKFQILFVFVDHRLASSYSRKGPIYRGHRPKLPYSTRPPLTASGGQEGRNRPVTVSRHLCRDDFHQASSIAHVTRRQHSHAVRPHSVKLSKSSDLSSDSSRPTK
ncbi:hypothetical protein EVAR_87695_1 [Eumeta japonica]|uniref:Uncharacterized protein n=1 Tax=Eumeta variegata TaxID=151549 RepID=A0A4C1T9X7_EUMVA|nr:hypothetical protein EVAR_87695_1 [Eumeta japonica]